MSFPSFCLQDRENCGSDRTVLTLVQGVPADLQADLLQSMDIPYDLSTLTAPRVTFRTKEWLELKDFVHTIPCTIVNATTGRVGVSFNLPATSKIGLFLSEFAVEDTQDAGVTWTTKAKFPGYLEVTPSLDNIDQDVGITLAEVRLFLRDNCPADNYLLDSTEFTTGEIYAVMRRPIDLWNETRPFMGDRHYTVKTFPYRYQYLNAILGELLRIVAFNEIRNNLSVNAAGVGGQDRTNGPAYMQLSDKLIGEYKEFVAKEKVAINIHKAFASYQIPSFGR